MFHVIMKPWDSQLLVLICVSMLFHQRNCTVDDVVCCHLFSVLLQQLFQLTVKVSHWTLYKKASTSQQISPSNHESGVSKFPFHLLLRSARKWLDRRHKTICSVHIWSTKKFHCFWNCLKKTNFFLKVHHSSEVVMSETQHVNPQ